MHYYRFNIIDTGKGISDEVIDKINNSDQNFTVQKENSMENNLGTGYGLNIVMKLCTILNSKLKVKKNEPCGTIFYFDIAVPVSISANVPSVENIISESKDVIELKQNLSDLNVTSDILNKDNKISQVSIINNEEIDLEIKLPNLFTLNEKLVFDKYEKNDISLIVSNESNEAEDSSNEDKPNLTEIAEFQEDIYKRQKRNEELVTVKRVFEMNIPKKFLKEPIQSDNEEIRIIDNKPKKSNKSLGFDNQIKEKKPNITKKDSAFKPTISNKKSTSKILIELNSKKPSFSPQRNNRSIKETANESVISVKEPLGEFGINLVVSRFKFNENEGSEKKYTIVIVDDEMFIRGAIKWVIVSNLKNCTKNINLDIIEASDGMECVLALYLAWKKKIKIDAIISDETMPFISGSYSSKIIEELTSKGSLSDVKMFISTAISHTNIKGIYSKVVNKN